LKKLDLGQTVGILANLGVIAGIVFLGVELQQNNALLEAEARLAQAERGEEIFDDMIRNAEFAAAVSKLQSGEEFSPVERVQLTAFLSRLFRGWQWQYFEREYGSLDTINIETWRNGIRGRGAVRANSEDFASSVWEANRGTLDPEFVRFVDENVFSE
jgi:hypothetical protein